MIDFRVKPNKSVKEIIELNNPESNLIKMMERAATLGDIYGYTELRRKQLSERKSEI